MKIEEMVDVFLNSSNFAKYTFLTLVPPSGYALNLKTLIKVSKVSWTSQLSYEILRSLFERKFYKTNFISPKKTPPKSPHLLGFNSRIRCFLKAKTPKMRCMLLEKGLHPIVIYNTPVWCFHVRIWRSVQKSQVSECSYCYTVYMWQFSASMMSWVETRGLPSSFWHIFWKMVFQHRPKNLFICH